MSDPQVASALPAGSRRIQILYFPIKVLGSSRWPRPMDETCSREPKQCKIQGFLLLCLQADLEQQIPHSLSQTPSQTIPRSLKMPPSYLPGASRRISGSLCSEACAEEPMGSSGYLAWSSYLCQTRTGNKPTPRRESHSCRATGLASPR